MVYFEVFISRMLKLNLQRKLKLLWLWGCPDSNLQINTKQLTSGELWVQKHMADIKITTTLYLTNALLQTS